MSQSALILGDGPAALRVAEGLCEDGVQVRIATPGDAAVFGAPADGAEVLPKAAVQSCRYVDGNYRVGLHTAGESRRIRTDHIVVAMESLRVPCFVPYGLEPSPRVISLSQAVAGLPEAVVPDMEGSELTVLFLLGLVQESHPVLAAEAMRCALDFQQHAGARCVIMTGNLKVAADRLESLYHDCRNQGVFFVKRTRPPRDILQEESGVVNLSYHDEVTRERFSVRADVTVVDEAVVPSPALAQLAETLELETDRSGFLQADNVHRLPVLTNRKNVWVAGPSRAVSDANAVHRDVAWIAQTAARQRTEDLQTPDDRARIDTGLCVRCLTCFRLCPYRAVTIGSRMDIDPHRCERCGICMAECPAVAIQIPGLEPESVHQALAESSGAGGAESSPEIVAFGCSRSAMRAQEMISGLGKTLPAGLRIFEVPCAGSVSTRHILTALISGVDGVLLLHCHPDNCHSGSGNRLAVQRVDRLRKMAVAIGLDPDRILSIALASNMGAVFADRANAFEALLRERGSVRSQKKSK